jgi:hypothetical protein
VLVRVDYVADRCDFIALVCGFRDGADVANPQISRLAKNKNRPALAERMGTSIAMIKHHYDGRGKPSEAERYWNIKPQALANVVSMEVCEPPDCFPARLRAREPMNGSRQRSQ